MFPITSNWKKQQHNVTTIIGSTVHLITSRNNINNTHFLHQSNPETLIILFKKFLSIEKIAFLNCNPRSQPKKTRILPTAITISLAVLLLPAFTHSVPVPRKFILPKV